jgi:hypothetical protein
LTKFASNIKHQKLYRKMKTLSFSLLAISLFACSSNFAQDGTRAFSVKDFDKLDIGSAFTITVTQGSTYSVSARGRQKDLDEMESKIKGSELHLGYKNQSWSMGKNRKNVYITITMPALKAVDFSGASTSKISGFSSETFDIELSGASTAEFKIDSKNMKIDLSGASDLTLIGNGDKLDAEVSGASDLKAYNFKTTTAKVESSGASDARVAVSGNLVADASGAASVSYKGSPSVKKTSSGAGTVRGSN